MSCERHEALLSALSDGELNGFASWRLRRHLSRCPRCAALYADIERVTAAARAIQESTATVQPAPGLTDSIRQRIAEADTSPPDVSALTPVFTGKEEPMQPANVSHQPLINRIYPTGWQRIALPAAAALFTVVCAVGLGLQIFGGAPRAAFADVQRAIDSIQIARVRFQMTTGINASTGENTKPETITVYEAWLRAEPAGYTMILPGGVRMSGGSDGIFLQTGGGEAQKITATPVTRADVRKALLAPERLLDTKPGEEGVAWGEPVVVPGAQGTPVLRFASVGSAGSRTLWVDATSHRPTRMQVTQVNRPPVDDATEAVEIVTEFTVDFSYNETPPQGTFDIPNASKMRE